MNIKKLLQDYNKKKAEISIIEYDIEERKTDIFEQNMGLSYDGVMVSGSKNIASAVEKQAITVIDDKEIKYMESLIIKHKKEIEIVDKLIDVLSEKKRNIIKMMYIDKVSPKDMAYKLDRTEKTIHQIKREALAQLQDLANNIKKS